MYTTLSTRLYVEQSAAPEFSQAVSMEGVNAVVMDVTVFSLKITTVGESFSLELQGSNDLENWFAIDAGLNIVIVQTAGGVTPGYFTSGSPYLIPGVPTAYVRIAYTTDSAAAGDYIIVNAGLNTFKE